MMPRDKSPALHQLALNIPFPIKMHITKVKQYLWTFSYLKDMVHPKMKFLSWFTPHISTSCLTQIAYILMKVNVKT